MRSRSDISERIRRRLTLEQYRSGSAVLRYLPEWFVLRGGLLLAGTVARFGSDRRLLVERNLRRAAPAGTVASGAALRRAVQETFETYARYYIDSARLPALSPAEVDAGFTFVDYDNIADAQRTGPGAILALPHVGSWEWAGVWLAQRPGLRVTAVVEPIRHPELFEWMAGFRRRIGIDVVPAGPEALGTLTQALHDGHVVCLLCDRDIGGGGVEVEFFGERTTLPAGAAVLARRTGAAIVPTVVYYRMGKRHAVTSPPILLNREGRLRDAVTAATQSLARQLEEMIGAAPTQWHLMQPNWPSDRQAIADRQARRRSPVA